MAVDLFPPVAVLMGGISPEREVSIASGRNVVKALKQAGFIKVFEVLIQSSGEWQINENPPLDANRAISELKERGIACFFIALHGTFGEDGTIQGFLETSNVPYTGSGIRASAIGMSKSVTRAILYQAGINIPNGDIIWNGSIEDIVSKINNKIGFPCFIKNDDSGSSLGVYFVENKEKLIEVFNKKLVFFPFVVEEYIKGIEVTVPIIDIGKPRALTPVEIVPKERKFFDYKAKYDPQFCEEICPPKSISPELISKIKILAINVHKIIGCRDATRVDFIIQEGVPYVLEINTIPGMTPGSLFPKSAEAEGLGFSEAVKSMVIHAIERNKKRNG